MPSVEEQDAVSHQFVLGELIPRLLGLHQGGNEVIPGVLAAILSQRLDVAGKLHHRLVGFSSLFVRVAEFVKLDDLGRPGAQQVAILLRNPQ